MHAGVAPIPASSSKTERYRLARGGNRQLNVALHRIAVTQTPSRRPRPQLLPATPCPGDTTMEALRGLKRRLARAVFNLLKPTDTHAGPCLPAAA